MSTSTTPASDAFISCLTSMVNQDDISAILEAQTQMLSRFEKTNEMLSNFNNLSAARYEKTLEEFKEHTQTLLDMKKDLDSIFRRIRLVITMLGLISLVYCLEWAVNGWKYSNDNRNTWVTNTETVRGKRNKYIVVTVLANLKWQESMFLLVSIFSFSP